MKFKFDESGNIVAKNNLPVFTLDDGTEQEMDVVATISSLETKLGAEKDEKQRHYEKNQKLMKELKPFKGLDLDKANEALGIVKNLKDKELLDANGIEVVKKELTADLTKAFTEKENEIKKAFEDERKQWESGQLGQEKIIRQLVIDNKFATDPHFSGTPENPAKTIYPAADAAKIFGKNFDVKMVEGKAVCVAKYDDGKPIMSKVRIGDPADFAEAVSILFDTHPHKEQISNTGPAGGPPGSRGNLSADGKKFDAMTPKEKIAAGLKKRGVT
jgi:hypothetical protein